MAGEDLSVQTPRWMVVEHAHERQRHGVLGVGCMLSTGGENGVQLAGVTGDLRIGQAVGHAGGDLQLGDDSQVRQTSQPGTGGATLGCGRIAVRLRR